MRYVTTMTIAGSDCSGGAGVQADIKTMSALGCYAASVITSITVQNTLGVTAVEAVSPDVVAGQIRAVMDDIQPQAIKIGMVNDTSTILAIASALKAYPHRCLVVDPVMVSTSGCPLMQPDALAVFVSQLLPMATLLTPNIPEAEMLAGMSITSTTDVDRAASIILAKGCKAVLIKGGHFEGDVKQDCLYDAEGHRVTFAQPSVPTTNTHGTGCTLSSAITCFLAQGSPLDEAVRQAKEYITRALQAGADVEIGGGHGPVNHFFDPRKLIVR